MTHYACFSFFCPAIVSPESIDIELPRQDVQAQNILRRGLVVIAKILQSLSNNLLFGKEVHMVFLNPLLESSIGSMSRFLEEPFVSITKFTSTPVKFILHADNAIYRARGRSMAGHDIR